MIKGGELKTATRKGGFSCPSTGPEVTRKKLLGHFRELIHQGIEATGLRLGRLATSRELNMGRTGWEVKVRG